MTVGPRKTKFIFDRGCRVWLLCSVCSVSVQVRTSPVSLWSVSEVSYLSVTADIHMSHFSNFTHPPSHGGASLPVSSKPNLRDSCCQLGGSEYCGCREGCLLRPLPLLLGGRRGHWQSVLFLLRNGLSLTICLLLLLPRTCSSALPSSAEWRANHTIPRRATLGLS